MGGVEPGGELVVFDLDGTITRRDTLLPYALGYVLRHPWRLPRLLLLLPALLAYACRLLDRGTLKSLLVRTALGGLSRQAVDAWTERWLPGVLAGGLYREALQAIAAARARGATLVLLSASPDLYVPALAARLGFARTLCTPLRWHSDARLDGRLAAANCRGEEKARHLAALLAELRPARSSAYGNSRADLPHLRLVNEGVYVNGRAVPSGAGHIRIEHWRGRGGLQPPAGAGRRPVR
ncbi:MAG: HAD-IB family hydrolase [Gammaproteobacteria bacterium]|nr:HAD-IB family hydrolase [Gammaproteobacteria bacterium]